MRGPRSVPGVPAAPTIRCALRLAPAEVHAVAALVAAAADADGVEPLSEHVRLHLPAGGDPHARHLLAADTSAGRYGQLTGYAHLDLTDVVAGASAELVVHPEARGHGLGLALVQAALQEARGAGRRPLRLWAHGELPAAEALAHRLGFTRVRDLLRMRRSLSPDLPPVRLPPGVVLRGFGVGADEAAWVELNRRAFSGHPEQGDWTVADVRLREAEPWFDAAGFLLAADAEGDLVGFHWTKVHGSTPGAHEHAPVGEVYVVGVDPERAGHGLGRALTLAGLHSLRDRGLAEAMLYVDASNVRAVALYERLGFTRAGVDVSWREPLAAPAQTSNL